MPRPGAGVARAAALTVAIVVGVGGLVLMALSAWVGVRSVQALTTPDALKRADHENAQFTCLERRLRQLVPRGSTVDVAIVPQPSWHIQRLTEWSTDWAHVVADPARAQYVLEVVGTPRRGCFGLDISASRP